MWHRECWIMSFSASDMHLRAFLLMLSFSTAFLTSMYFVISCISFWLPTLEYFRFCEFLCLWFFCDVYFIIPSRIIMGSAWNWYCLSNDSVRASISYSEITDTPRLLRTVEMQFVYLSNVLMVFHRLLSLVIGFESIFAIFSRGSLRDFLLILALRTVWVRLSFESKILALFVSA